MAKKMSKRPDTKKPIAPKTKVDIRERKKANTSTSSRLDPKATQLSDWRAEVLDSVRDVIKKAVPDAIEERKWRGIPVWTYNGIICTGETYKRIVKLTFAKGASLPDPEGLFNSSLDGKIRRAIDIHEGETLLKPALSALVKSAAALNVTHSTKISKAKSNIGKKNASSERTTAADPRLLSGGNPQIPKGYGDEPVQAYIRAMPGWKRALGAQLDALVVKAVPEVYKAVKWNSPLYGIEGEGWFLGLHCFNKYIKVAFFNGASLEPLPPQGSTQKHIRYLHLHEQDVIDEVQFMDWVKQASKLPGERM